MADAAAEARIDRGLVARALLADDARAFEQLVRRHQGMVRAQLRRLLHGDHARADDLAQETFLLAWRKLDQFRGEARFSTWLHRIAYTCFLQARRTRQTITRDEIADITPSEPLHAQHAADLRHEVMRAMQRLSPDEQTVLLHCTWLGLSHDEAAYVLAMPLGTVKSHMVRGKAKLRALLAEWQHDQRKDGHS